MDYLNTYNSAKDSKLQRKVCKPVEKVICTDDGLTVGQVVKKLNEAEAELTKQKAENLKIQSENLALFNKMNNTIETLIKKVSKLENSVSTLLSGTANE